MTSARTPFVPYIAPFAVFLLFIGLDQLLAGSTAGGAIATKYWLYPLQTFVCAGLLAVYWKHYSFRPLGSWWVGAVAGIVVLGIWISPQVLFGAPSRLEGFNPGVFPEGGTLYWLTVIARFARLVLVVPLVEEIFWRGFLMRYLVKEDFQTVPFGTYRPLAFFGTALLFMLEHGTADYPAAFLAGVIYNAVAVKTKSLFACVIAHAVTNALLGFYIMATKQWGFW